MYKVQIQIRRPQKPRNPAPFQHFSRRTSQNARPFQRFQSEPQKPSAISTFPSQIFHTPQVRSSRFSALRVLQSKRLKRTIMNVQPNNPNPPSPETSVLSVSSVISVLIRKSCEHPARPQWRVPNAFQSQRDHLKTFDL